MNGTQLITAWLAKRTLPSVPIQRTPTPGDVFLGYTATEDDLRELANMIDENACRICDDEPLMAANLPARLLWHRAGHP